MTSIITIDGLSKRFRDVIAVDDLSFTVEEGGFFAFLGTNGAGKTTTISCMITLQRVDQGTIVIDGLRVGRDDHDIRERIGVVFQQSLLDPGLTARENLRLRAAFYGIAPSRIDEVADLVDLTGFLGRRYGVLSGGERRRVDIARALLHQPRVLFLDEPTTGLDPQSRDQVWAAIGELRSTLGLTVFLTTHYMHETESADRVLVIDHGKALADGTPRELRARYSAPLLTLVPAPGQRDIVLSSLERVAPHAAWSEASGAILVPMPDSHSVRTLLSEASDSLADFQYVQGSMDDVFLNLTTERSPR